MLNIIQDIRPLTDFKKNTVQFISVLKKSGRPTVLTVNGKAEIVVIDASAFQKMQERLEMEENLADIRQSWQDFEDGNYSSAEEVFEELKQRITQPQKKISKAKRN